MRRFISRFVLLFVVTFGLLLPVYAEEPVNGDRALLASPWKGYWISPKGFLFTANVRLRVSQDFSVEGEIGWVLERSPREEDKPKLGLSATEYVRGSYDPRARILRLEGYRKDDPNQVIGLDKYHLVLADSSQVLGGITWDHGTWQGLISLSRVPAN